MEETPSNYGIRVEDPVTGDSVDFNLEEEMNISLVMRLIKKRSDVFKSSRSKIDKVIRIREEKGIDKLDKEISKVSSEIQSLAQEADEPDSEFTKRDEELTKQIRELRDRYPKELIELQSESESLLHQADRIGLKVCQLILNPVTPIPSNYIGKNDFLEEALIDIGSVDAVIDFFLTQFSFSTKSLREPKRTVHVFKKENQG